MNTRYNPIPPLGTMWSFRVAAMSHDGRAVANFVLDFCEVRNRNITNLSLQKIVYFCHVWSLIKRQKPLVKHQFEAWQYGPVLQYLYREFRAYDSSPIAARATKIHAVTGQKVVVNYDFDTETTALLECIVDFYSRLRAADLVELSHVKGGPWDQSWNHNGTINPGMKIDDGIIQEYYSKMKPPYLLQ